MYVFYLYYRPDTQRNMHKLFSTFRPKYVRYTYIYFKLKLQSDLIYHFKCHSFELAYRMYQYFTQIEFNCYIGKTHIIMTANVQRSLFLDSHFTYLHRLI